MKHLPKSSSIVTLKETCEDDNDVHLVMDYPERAAAGVTKTIMEVVKLFHKHGIYHRDLKPENVLFANNKENSLLKAIDFGLSIFFKSGEKFSEIVGSPYYMAHEVIKRSNGPEIDIWSAGVILYFLLGGVPPFWAVGRTSTTDKDLIYLESRQAGLTKASPSTAANGSLDTGSSKGLITPTKSFDVHGS